MIEFFDTIRDFSFLSIVVRLALCFLSAGIIGFERGRVGRAAGLRTHILVGLGACIVMITDHYLVSTVSPNADPARLGAQVISGIGFLGAGTILVTGKRITGLTTAAGLWTTACVGLAYGGGYFEGGLLVTAIMVVTIAIMHNWEGRSSTMIRMELLVEIERPEDIPCLLDTVRVCGGDVRNVDIDDDPRHVSKAGNLQVRLSLKVGVNFNATSILEALSRQITIVVFKEL
ncbi:MAG: MgtC/SapB family protein [Christensenella sp.]|uniref:MgtC/SapB family protein n=1 Tax=Christensenella sp. TaxID=1935934 RepID=UPI002B203E68|nr:MgtC/SapB family protein [Christensenella sp.]MEA5002868.1 MgtC/SapB family protein [Christensenella sp.]